jgi:hypothetical protein
LEEDFDQFSTMVFCYKNKQKTRESGDPPRFHAPQAVVSPLPGMWLKLNQNSLDTSPADVLGIMNIRDQRPSHHEKHNYTRKTSRPRRTILDYQVLSTPSKGFTQPTKTTAEKHYANGQEPSA